MGKKKNNTKKTSKEDMRELKDFVERTKKDLKEAKDFVKDESKAIEKEADNVKDEFDAGLGILFPGIKKLMKRIRIIGFAGVIASFFSIIVVATIVISTLIVIGTHENRIQLIESDLVIDTITKLNDWDEQDTMTYIMEDSNFELVAFDLIIPGILYLLVGLFGIVFFKSVGLFAKDINTNKELFTPLKLKELKSIKVMYLVFIFLAYIGGIGTLIAFILVELILEFLVYSFERNVEAYK